MAEARYVRRIALATLADSRDDFFAQREPLVREESSRLGWLASACQLIESGVLRADREVRAFAEQIRREGAHALIIHLPIWADPAFALRLAALADLPVLLLGNTRPDTSSIVGMLGAGGALDQAGIRHIRVFDHGSDSGRQPVLAFIQAASARANLRGMRLGLFGGRSLGIVTADADPVQWMRLFGVDIERVDQLEIVQAAEAFDPEAVARHLRWLEDRVGGVRFGGGFTPAAFEKQIRSYLATRDLSVRYGFDFVGVKCQRELSDKYVTQCAAHMLFNGTLDADGQKLPVVHACESDADGALTMQILQLISGGSPTALLDIRWFNPKDGTWLLANCGAAAAAFYATPEDPDGLSQVEVQPHVFGEGGGGAYPGLVAPKEVTLARLCRKDGHYWMAIAEGEVLPMSAADADLTTPAFPQARVRIKAGLDLLEQFGANHIHLTGGRCGRALVAFCEMSGIDYKVWD
jgi:L-fucose isomerase